MILDLIPLHVTQLCFELDDTLFKIVKNPLLSDWQSCLQARQVHGAMQARRHSQISRSLSLHDTVLRELKICMFQNSSQRWSSFN